MNEAPALAPSLAADEQQEPLPHRYRPGLVKRVDAGGELDLPVMDIGADAIRVGEANDAGIEGYGAGAKQIVEDGLGGFDAVGAGVDRFHRVEKPALERGEAQGLLDVADDVFGIDAVG